MIREATAYTITAHVRGGNGAYFHPLLFRRSDVKGIIATVSHPAYKAKGMESHLYEIDLLFGKVHRNKITNETNNIIHCKK